MSKRIWIVNYYTGTPKTTSNPRYIEFDEHLRKAGYDVITFNSSLSAGTQEGQTKSGVKFLERTYGDSKFVHINAPVYLGNGIKRMYSIFMFAWSLFVHRRRFEKPDLILHNLHTPFDYPIFWLAHRWKVRYIAEAWDMWPENFVTFGLISADNPVMKIAYRMERHLYEKADEIVFTFEGGLDYLKEKHWTTDTGGKIDLKKIHYINNGVNLEKFDADCKAYPSDDADLNNLDTYKIIYLGSIRLVNNVQKLIDAAELLKDNTKYRFLIYGDGNDRELLEQYVRSNHIDNVIFKEKWIPLCEVAYVVSQATINIMNYQKNFGIHGVSSGKMFQYMAAGKPICCNIKLNYSEISRNNLGIDYELDTPEQYATAIRTLAEQPPEDYTAMCARVRTCAENYDYKELAKHEISVIKNLFTIFKS